MLRLSLVSILENNARSDSKDKLIPCVERYVTEVGDEIRSVKDDCNDNRPLAWDVTVPDTYADSHVVNTAREAGAAANHAATNKNTKYSQLSNTHVFVPVAIETGDTWHHQAVELVQEIGRRTTVFLAVKQKSIALGRH